MTKIWLSCFLVWCATTVHAQDFTPFERAYGLPIGLLAGVQFQESHVGQGTTPVVAVVAANHLPALHKIARRVRRPVASFVGSSAGAMGAFQILPGTWWQFQQDGNGDGLRDPYNVLDSAATAAYILAYKTAKRGSLEAALAWYCGGYPQYARLILARLR